jgi:hypothetical protein
MITPYEPIVFNADIFENDILSTKKLEVNVIVIKKNKKNIHYRKIIGKRRFKLKSILEIIKDEAFTIDILDENNKT